MARCDTIPRQLVYETDTSLRLLIAFPCTGERIVPTVALEGGVEVARCRESKQREQRWGCLHGNSPATVIMPPPGTGVTSAATVGRAGERVANPMTPVATPATATPESTMLATW